MTTAARLAVISAAVELTIVVAVNSTFLQPGDVIAAHWKQQHQQPCISDTGSLCRVSVSRPSAGASDRRHRPRRSSKRRAERKSPLPRQNVTVNDRSVAEALAMSADVGRGPPPPVRPARPLDAQPATSGGSAASMSGMLALGCESEPCQHGGVCYTDVFSPRGFSCRCATGYYGDVCEYDTELCLSGPCLNDAKCSRDPDDPSTYRCDCAPGFYGLNCERELTHEALQLMSDESSMSDYYDLTMNPLLLQLVIAASSLFILIVIVTFCCCIEIRRDTIVEKRKLLRAIGLAVEFPRISFISIGWKLIISCLTCRCLTMGAKKDSVDPRANIPLIMPATAPPVPRAQNNNAGLTTQSELLSDVLSAQQWQQLQQLEAQRAYSLQRQMELEQLQQQLQQQQQQQQQQQGY